MRPSLSVVQAEPSRHRNEAPALSSPANPSEPFTRPSTNHLNPTGTSYTLRPMPVETRSIMLLLTTVLPIAAPAGHPVRCRYKYEMHTARYWLGCIRPPLLVTM